MRFSKWHALGNSYVLLEPGDATRPLDSEWARRLCDVRYGIGSDGVLEVLDVRGAEAEIVIWNPDGSVAEFSGNGSRIAAAWLGRRAGAARVAIAVSGRTYPAAIRDDGTIEMGVGDVEVGVVERMIALPSCEALEVGDLLIPMVRDAIRSIDLEARRIDVDMGFVGE